MATGMTKPQGQPAPAQYGGMPMGLGEAVSSFAGWANQALKATRNASPMNGAQAAPHGSMYGQPTTGTRVGMWGQPHSGTQVATPPAIPAPQEAQAAPAPVKTRPTNAVSAPSPTPGVAGAGDYHPIGQPSAAPVAQIPSIIPPQTSPGGHPAPAAKLGVMGPPAPTDMRPGVSFEDAQRDLVNRHYNQYQAGQGLGYNANHAEEARLFRNYHGGMSQGDVIAQQRNQAIGLGQPGSSTGAAGTGDPIRDQMVRQLASPRASYQAGVPVYSGGGDADSAPLAAQVAAAHAGRVGQLQAYDAGKASIAESQAQAASLSPEHQAGMLGAIGANPAARQLFIGMHQQLPPAQAARIGMSNPVAPDVQSVLDAPGKNPEWMLQRFQNDPRFQNPNSPESQALRQADAAYYGAQENPGQLHEDTTPVTTMLGKSVWNYNHEANARRQAYAALRRKFGLPVQ